MPNYFNYVKHNPHQALRIMDIQKETISDGLGLRMSLYFSGCIHACPGCHNQKSWDYAAGELLDEQLLKQIITKYRQNPLLDGITLTGGDPFYQSEALLYLLKTLKKELDTNIWVYTGYRFEELLDNEALPYIDVLVDGKFIKELYQPELTFKGSANQRIIDVPKSLQSKEIELYIK
jgi:anaerobic ribonucleoside-triphosphate reductase activating protein